MHKEIRQINRLKLYGRIVEDCKPEGNLVQQT